MTEDRELTRVVWRTFASRGKSFTPLSRIEMLEDRRAFVDRSEATHEPNGFAIEAVNAAGFFRC